MALHSERQPDRVPGCRIRILSRDQYPHIRERSLEGTEHVVSGRQVAPPLGLF
jgi:hypothetical protein